jgi:hypothetical protein
VAASREIALFLVDGYANRFIARDTDTGRVRWRKTLGGVLDAGSVDSFNSAAIGDVVYVAMGCSPNH